MIERKTISRADKLFADQFELTDDGNFLYRRNRSGPAIKVWPHERDEFVNDFITARTWGTRGMIAAVIVLVVSAVAIFTDANSPSSDEFIWIGSGIIVAGFTVFLKWMWKAPTRALAERQQLAPKLEKVVARQANLQRMKWGQFAWAGIMLLIGGVWIATKINLLAGWHRLILLAGFLYLVLLVLRMWQKWEVERNRE